MRPWGIAAAFVVVLGAVLGLAACDYSPADVGYRPPKANGGQTASASSGQASSGTSNGGDVAIGSPKTSGNEDNGGVH
jgi:hypothetical protein